MRLAVILLSDNVTIVMYNLGYCVDGDLIKILDMKYVSFKYCIKTSSQQHIWSFRATALIRPFAEKCVPC